MWEHRMTGEANSIKRLTILQIVRSEILIPMTFLSCISSNFTNIYSGFSSTRSPYQQLIFSTTIVVRLFNVIFKNRDLLETIPEFEIFQFILLSSVSKLSSKTISWPIVDFLNVHFNRGDHSHLTRDKILWFPLVRIRRLKTTGASTSLLKHIHSYYLSNSISYSKRWTSCEHPLIA